MTAIKDAARGYTLSYGGVDFGPLCRYRLTGTPEYDPAKRSVVFVRYRLSVTSYEYATTPGELGTNMRTRRRLLMEPGARLAIADIGWGDTNTKTSHAEMVWGPRPLRADFTPLGGGVCWQLDWECEFCVSECSATDGKIRSTRPFIMFNYEAIYSNDDQGFTTRQISGVVTIPQLRDSTKTLKDIPIAHRDSVIIAVPYGYRRVQSEWRENIAQNQLSFTLRDVQINHDPFPPGIADADIEFAVSSDQAMANVNYGFSISGTLETLPGWPKEHAATTIYQIVTSKLSALQGMLYNASFVPQSIEMRYGIFRRRSNFRFTFLIAGAPRNSIFQTGVLYSPTGNQFQFASAYNAWINGAEKGPSLSTLWGNRGQTNLQTVPESIVDVCDPRYFVYLGNNLGAPVQPPGYVNQRLPADFFNCDSIREENSWLAYEPVVQLLRTNNLRVNKRDVFQPELAWTGKAPLDSLRSSSTVAGDPYKDVGDKVTRNGAPEQLLIFKGKGIRIKFPVSVPKLRSIEGVVLDEVNHGQESVRGPSIGNCPTWYGRFIWVYRPRSYLSGEAVSSPTPKIEFAKP